MIFFLSLSLSFPSCSTTEELPKGAVTHISRPMKAGETFCFWGNKYLYVFFNRFSNCKIEAEYYTDSSFHTMLDSFSYKENEFVTPVLDFFIYTGKFSITAEKDTFVEFHAVIPTEMCLNRLFFSNRLPDILNFDNNKFSTEDFSHTCIFLFPSIQYDLHVEFNLDPNDKFIIFGNGEAPIELKGENTYEKTVNDGHYYVLSAGKNSQRILIQVSGNKTMPQTKLFSKFVPIFNHQYPTIFPAGIIAIISVGTIFGCILFGIIVVVIIIEVKRLKKKNISINDVDCPENDQLHAA